jgi:hypothetical protein
MFVLASLKEPHVLTSMLVIEPSVYHLMAEVRQNKL